MDVPDKWGAEMKDMIYRDDAIKVARSFLRNDNEWFREALVSQILMIPSADIPQGDVDAVDIFEREIHNLEQGYITLGEFDERIEPLRHLCYGRPQGEWFKDDEGTFICSACGSGYKDQPTLMGKPMFKWCPICGARMRGAEDEML